MRRPIPNKQKGYSAMRKTAFPAILALAFLTSTAAAVYTAL